MKNPEKLQTGYGPVTATLGTVVLYFGSQILAAFVVVIVGMLVFGVGENELDDWVELPLVQLALATAGGAALVGGIWWLLKALKTQPAAIGWRAPKVDDLKTGLIGFAAYLPLVVAALSLVMWLAPGVDPTQEQQLGFERDSTGWALGLAFVSLVLIAPVVEEMLVRGFLFRGLRKKLNFLASALASSALFAVAHLQLGLGETPLWMAAADTFVLGFVAAYLMEKTGSLWPCIILHTAKNSLAFVLGFVLN